MCVFSGGECYRLFFGPVFKPLKGFCGMTSHANLPFLNSLAIIVLKNLIKSEHYQACKAASFDAGGFRSSDTLLRKGSGSTSITGKMFVQVRSRR